LYDVRKRRWYNLPDVPGNEPIGYGSDIVTGEITPEPPPHVIPKQYVKIYISKGAVSPGAYAYEFFVYYFPLSIPAEQFSPGDDTIEALISRSYFERLQNFLHGHNSRMTFNPSFRAGGTTDRKEIYALRGTDGEVLRYNISTNTWDYLTGVPWSDLGNPSIGMYGVIGNGRAPEPHQNFSYFFVLRGGWTKHIGRYNVDNNVWIRISRPEYEVEYGKIVYGLYCHTPRNPGTPKDGMWVFFDHPSNVVGFLRGLGEETSEEPEE
jgi:hypothetical protein